MEKNLGIKKNNKKQEIMVALIVLLSATVVVESFIILNSKKAISKSNNCREIALNIVETPIVDLKYNEMEVDNLRVSYNESVPYEVTFYADIDDEKNITLFSFNFGGDKGIVIGEIKDKTGNDIVVRLVQHIFAEEQGLTESQIERLNYVQTDMIDCIIANMSFVETADMAQKEELEEQCMKIETPFVNLLYPKEWKDYLEVEKIERENYQVKFYCQFPNKEKIELFTYIFGESDGTLVGYLDDVKIGIIIGNEDADESWTEEEKEIFYTMREDAGVIVDGLTKVNGLEVK